VGEKPLAETGRFELVAPLAAGARSADRRSCGGCDAQSAPATLAITGWVQKVSNVILNMKVRDAGTGRLLAGASVATRRNTQRSRSRALADPVANRLLGPGAS
jgi:hypothetical protein